ncbi:MAG: site-2 protease family protein [Polyangiales bacterium]
MPVLYFVVMVGVLVFVHELGHFLWARVFGVRVLRFSLGFGPRIAGFQRGGTDYVISALPLGGYVRMLGENPRDEIRPADEVGSIAHQSIWRRFVIAVGGPLMSLTFPVLLYFVVFLGDTRLTPSTIGLVLPNRPASGKLLPGDQVVEIDGAPIETFYDLTRIVERSPGKPLRFAVQRNGKRVEETIEPVADFAELPLEVRKRVGRIGIVPNHPLAVIGVGSATSPAASARLRTFDVVVAAAGRPIDRFLDLERALERNRGTLVPLTYLRPTTVHGALGGLFDLDLYEPRVAALTPEPGKGDALGRAGIELADLYVSDVIAGSPEQRIGLLSGDRLLALDGRETSMWAAFVEDLREGRGVEHELRWRHDEQEHTARFALEHEHGVTEHGQDYDRYVLGIRNWVPSRLDASVPNPHPLVYAARESVRATTEVVELTLVSILRLMQGRLSIKSIGGPLTIFDVAGTAARQGALNYLTLMAFISINLGLINLLPIPLLDGGHLLFLLWEVVARKPLSVKLREYAHIAGLLMLLAIMILAFKNDLERQWPQIVDDLTAE